METRVFNWDPNSPVKKLFHYDHAEDKFHIETLLDATEIIENNKALSSLAGSDANWKGDLHRVASIPMTIYMDMVKKGITKDQKALRKWLNDPANMYFRTRGGKV